MRSGWLVLLILCLPGCDDVNCTSLDFNECVNNYPDCAYVGFVSDEFISGNCLSRCYPDDPDCPEGTTCDEARIEESADQGTDGAACFLD